MKRFKTVSFKINEEKNITFILKKDDLGWLNNFGDLIFENGEFEIMVGGSSQDYIKSTVNF